MLILMTCLWIRSKTLFFSCYRLRFLVRLDLVLHMTHRFEEFRFTGRIESKASVGQADRKRYEALLVGILGW